MPRTITIQVTPATLAMLEHDYSQCTMCDAWAVDKREDYDVCHPCNRLMAELASAEAAVEAAKHPSIHALLVGRSRRDGR
jgi:hypothetical protein